MATKPENCTCLYPQVRLRNGCGHSDDCPAYVPMRASPVIGTCDVCGANVMLMGAKRPLVLTCGKVSCESAARTAVEQALAILRKE